MLLALLSPGAKFGITLSAGVAAGVFNAIAGGGTFLTFPTLLALGVPALQANLTSAVGVLPSYIGGIQKFSRARDERRALLLTLFTLSLAVECYGYPIFPLTKIWFKPFITLVFSIVLIAGGFSLLKSPSRDDRAAE